MFALAHISDLHLALRPGRLAEFASKRGLGFINWHRRRKYIHRIEALNAITRDLQASGADHIAVTGDLVNLSLPSEYAWARTWLESVGTPEHVTVIPGNHDLYVPEAQRGPAEYWGEFMQADDSAESGAFPFIRRRGAVTLIALSTALATGPFLATGQLGENQLDRLGEALEQTRGSFRVVLIHHPPVSPPNRYLRRLIDAAEFRACWPGTAPISSCTVTITAGRWYGSTVRTVRSRRLVCLQRRRKRRTATKTRRATTFSISTASRAPGIAK